MIAYTFADYLFALWVFVPLVIWLAVEVFGLVSGLQRLVAVLTGNVPASAQAAAQRVTEAQFAATQNARQDLRGGFNGKAQ